MKHRIVAILTAIVLMFTFSACGADSGEIYDKGYEPAYTTEQWIPTYITVCDSKGICRQQPSGGYYQTNHHDECYKVSFRNAEGDTGSDCVSPADYEALDIGDYYEAS